MKDIVAIVLLTSCIIAVIPSKKQGIQSTISLIAGLSVLIVLCTPIARAAEGLRVLPERFMHLLLPSAEDLDETEVLLRIDPSKDVDEWVIRYGVRNIERGVQTLVASRFGWEHSDVYVDVETGALENGTVSVDRICIYLLNQASCRDAEVEKYISDILACPCKVFHGLP